MMSYELTNIFKRFSQEISQFKNNQLHMASFDIKSYSPIFRSKKHATSSLTNCFRYLTVFSMDSPVHRFLKSWIYAPRTIYFFSIINFTCNQKVPQQEDPHLLSQSIYFCTAMKRTGSITALLLPNLYFFVDMLMAQHKCSHFYNISIMNIFA